MPSKKVVETAEVLAFHDIEPLAPVHALVIPKKHIDKLASVDGADGELLGTLLLAAKDVAKKLNIAEGFQVRIASGAYAGQTVFHLHLHVTGGWKEKQSW